MAIIESGLSTLSAISDFTQQKPCNETVKVVKVAALIGAGVATSTTFMTLGPAGFVLRPALQVLIVRVVVIGSNTLCVGYRAYTENENFFLLMRKLSERKEENPYTVEVFSMGIAEYTWKWIKPSCIPDGTHELIVANIKGAVKVPVSALASYIGNCVHDLRLYEIGLSSRMNPITIAREESMKFTSLRIADGVHGSLKCENKLIYVQVLVGTAIFTLTRVAKKYLDSEEELPQLEPFPIGPATEDSDCEEQSSAPP